jgi:hypothetical protein
MKHFPAHKTFVLLLIFSFSSLFYSCQSDKKVKLEMRLKKGKTYTYTITTTQESKQTNVSGQQENIKQNMIFGYRMSVKDVDTGGNETIETAYDKVKLSTKSAYGNNTYDSEDKNDTASVMSKVFKALRSGTFTIIMSKEGIVKSISGYKDIIDRMVTSVAPGKDAQSQTLHQQISGRFNDKALKESLQNGWNIYPANAVGIGDSWTKSNSLSVGFPLDMVTTYTVKQIDRKKVVLDVKSDINAGKDSMATLMGIAIKIKGTQKGVIEIDRETGLPLHSDIRQEINGMISMVNQDSQKQMPVNAITTTVIEGKEQ